MKRYLFLTLVLFAIIAGLPAAEAPARDDDAKTGAVADDLSTCKTAEDLWTHIQDLRKQPTPDGSSPAAAIAFSKASLGRQRAAEEAFVKAYPSDPRRYSAKLMAIEAEQQLSQIPGAGAKRKLDSAAVLKDLDAIVAASDASEDVKRDAEFNKISLMADDLEGGPPKAVAAFFEACDEFLAKHGAHRLAPGIRRMEIQAAEESNTPEADAVLKRLANGKDLDVAGAAREIVGQRERIASLKKTPLDVKFTATDGTEFDVAKLRGKVVMLDFWASWCGPCIEGMPELIAVYEKFHGQGLEVAGISLDEDEAKLKRAIKAHGVPWVQDFDGRDGKFPITTRFGVRQIPTAWLLDKQGMLRETTLRGEGLSRAAAKLLAE